jgi:uncharacterized protein (TIGR02421 family)
MQLKTATSERQETKELPPQAARVDSALAELSAALDWIDAVSPVNIGEQWRRFQKSGCGREPEFEYRDQPDVSEQRDALAKLPVAEIEHPILKPLLVEKQIELSKLLDLIELRGTSGFMQRSIDLFGEAEPSLLAQAKELLTCVDGRECDADEECIGAREFAKAAEAELDYYRAECKEFHANVSISRHVAAGVMVDDGQLVIAADLKTRKKRLEALLQHEIGTHILTWFNGSLQPLHQLKSGLAHYDATQEGLGVLAEYLCGNLPLGRIRTLAGRVVAVRALTDGAEFVESYRMLTKDCGLSRFGAFVTATRVWRGGGLTKDAVYLRGLHDVLAYLSEGHSLVDLFIGKFSIAQSTSLMELQRQGWLVPARLLPRYWFEPRAHERLQRCAEHGITQLLAEATS